MLHPCYIRTRAPSTSPPRHVELAAHTNHLNIPKMYSAHITARPVTRDHVHVSKPFPRVTRVRLGRRTDAAKHHGGQLRLIRERVPVALHRTHGVVTGAFPRLHRVVVVPPQQVTQRAEHVRRLL